MTRNGPALWDALLDAVNVPGAVVSGGCIRDFYLGLLPHDIDIFVPHHEQDDLRRLAEAITTQGLGDMALQPGCGSYSTSNDPLVGVLEGELLGVPANILCNRKHEVSALELIEGHDFGITQACYGGTVTMSTDAFEADLKNKTATLMTTRSYERSLRRFDKFLSRNGPVLTLVDPFKNELKFT